jgi:hypothetical protein
MQKTDMGSVVLVLGCVSDLLQAASQPPCIYTAYSEISYFSS